MDPSKRVNKNPHVTPGCQGCIYENQDNPTKRPCFLCVRKEFMIIDSKLTTRELMAHYKEYFEEGKQTYRDHYMPHEKV
jgi:hypothetical protein